MSSGMLVFPGQLSAVLTGSGFSHVQQPGSSAIFVHETNKTKPKLAERVKQHMKPHRAEFMPQTHVEWQRTTRRRNS